MRGGKPNPEICPVCGAEVPQNAAACPECGADEETGWNEERRIYDGLDLPDEDFDYDDFIRREFGGGRPAGRKKLWWIVGICLLLILTAILAAARFR